ncbi:MAG TPA: penicillin acylase family protein [Candidatus Limnocylindria bacterium]|nr:penicillin acylase family protein [Candidatus Limnocylindria bacterium]
MTRTTRIVRNVFAALFVLLGIALLAGWWIVRRSLPTLDGSVSVSGFRDGVIVDRDQLGRPWIRAKSAEDMVMAQGYVTAQDRLWQMDLLRRAAAGELAEIFGGVALEFDKENRTLGLRQAAERAAGDSNPEIHALLDAYVRGVNRYIEERQTKLPIEFILLGYKPRAWTPADTYLISLFMYKTLTSTWKSKLNRQWITERVGVERAWDMFVVDSPLDHYIVGGAAPGKTHSPAPAHAKPGTHVSAASGNAPPFASHVWEDARAFLAQFEEESSEIIGSNNFVVSGSHTASGKPLLANDTHLGLGVPCIWYLVHLTAPGWNVTGFALPGAPLVIIGHNDQVAWGFTNSNADVQDLYVEKFESENSRTYRVNGAAREASARQETIHVRGKPDVVLTVLVTRHGPVVHRDPAGEGGRAYALRWTALEPGGLDFGFPLLGQTKNWDEFIEVTHHIAGPGQNIIYADVNGNIGYTMPARIPIRASGDGSLPVPGDTDEYEWKGYIPFEDLPRAWNPADGIIATANARTVGPAYKYFVSNRWAGPYRTARLYQLLAGRRGLLAADCNGIQNDILSLPNKFLAEQLILATRSNQSMDPRVKALIEKLKNWDAKATASSIETSFVEYTRHALFHNLLAPLLGDDTSKYELWEPRSIYNNVWWRDKVFLENILRTRPAAWLPKGFADYDSLLIDSANDAVAQLTRATQESDPARWSWGRLHPLDMSHPLGRGTALHSALSIGPYETGGTIDTVKAMGVGHGPAMRFVADLSNFDNSLMEITTGESGQFASRYYRDQFPEWLAGRGIPAPFSEGAENKTRTHRLFLLPAGASAPSR